MSSENDEKSDKIGSLPKIRFLQQRTRKIVFGICYKSSFHSPFRLNIFSCMNHFVSDENFHFYKNLLPGMRFIKLLHGALQSKQMNNWIRPTVKHEWNVAMDLLHNFLVGVCHKHNKHLGRYSLHLLLPKRSMTLTKACLLGTKILQNFHFIKLNNTMMQGFTLYQLAYKRLCYCAIFYPWQKLSHHIYGENLAHWRPQKSA